jgi:hypothetical protein
LLGRNADGYGKGGANGEGEERFRISGEGLDVAVAVGGGPDECLGLLAIVVDEDSPFEIYRAEALGVLLE